jgi:SAM-dependent methyltransferase
MTFRVSDSAYDRFMGRDSRRLAPAFADFAGVTSAQRALDVGAGTGALTSELALRVGEGNVAAAEPSPQFVAGLRARLPDADVREAPAERLPWRDESFDVALAQLVVSFVSDAPAAAGELRRVVRRGGTVAVCMWEEGGLELGSPLRAARDAVVPGAPGPRRLAYRTEGELLGLLAGAGLGESRAERLEVQSEYADFEEYWDAAVAMRGPDTAWLQELDLGQLEAVRAEVRRQLGSPDRAFTLGARAVAVAATRE